MHIVSYVHQIQLVLESEVCFKFQITWNYWMEGNLNTSKFRKKAGVSNTIPSPLTLQPLINGLEDVKFSYTAVDTKNFSCFVYK